MIFGIGFPDFKRFVEDHNKRIYYYQAGEILNLYFLSDGMVFKTFVPLNQIPNKEMFFGDRIFIGATQLLFPLNEPGDESKKLIGLIRPDVKIVDAYMPIETDQTNKDLQKEGVGDIPPGA